MCVGRQGGRGRPGRGSSGDNSSGKAAATPRLSAVQGEEAEECRPGRNVAKLTGQQCLREGMRAQLGIQETKHRTGSEVKTGQPFPTFGHVWCVCVGGRGCAWVL